MVTYGTRRPNRHGGGRETKEDPEQGDEWVEPERPHRTCEVRRGGVNEKADGPSEKAAPGCAGVGVKDVTDKYHVPENRQPKDYGPRMSP